MAREFKPILMLPRVGQADRTKQKPKPFGGPHVPGFERQLERLSPIFQVLQNTFESRQVAFQADPVGTVPEQVLVFETIGSISNFFGAVRRIEGMEWLTEWEAEISPDDDFYNEDNKTKELRGRLFLVMSNHQALTQMLSLWERYCSDPDVQFERGLNKWKELFQLLHSIRPWDTSDRLRETGIIDDWTERIELGEERVRFEVEFWFRSIPEHRDSAERSFRNILTAAGGQALSSFVLPKINYHGLLAEVPIQEIKKVINNEEVQLVKSDQVMFFRPVGQTSIDTHTEEPEEECSAINTGAELLGEPVVGLLDGLPVENHALLAGRLIVDDPDGWSEDYPANERRHGTGMSSLVIHGMLDSGSNTMVRPLYVRPILKPDVRCFNSPRPEALPSDSLPIDIVHQAVKRMFEGPNGQGVATSVKVINFSIGDPNRLFDQAMSSWARLLDWLSWKYKVLFIVSAGNHLSNLVLDIERNAIAQTSAEEIEASVLRALAADARNRRLLSPAESINSLTVGATHADACEDLQLGNRINPFHTDNLPSNLPSPCSAIGLGYRRAIKPDVLFPGGRQLFLERFSHQGPNVILEIARAIARPPGVKVAAPGVTGGGASQVHYITGTSCAAALVSHTAAQVYETIVGLRSEPNGEQLSDEYMAVLLKTMLVHGASWGEAYSTLQSELKVPENRTKFREYAARFLGFGIINSERLGECSDQRATLLGCGALRNEQAHLYSLPLPPSLSGRRIWRRLTVTLCWLSPINSAHQGYRRASLWFEFDMDTLRLKRHEADNRTVMRGTVQHEVFDGEDALAFVDGSSLNIKVNCRQDAGPLRDPIPYAIAVSLEVAQDIDLAIYEEIGARIRQAIPVQTE